MTSYETPESANFKASESALIEDEIKMTIAKQRFGKLLFEDRRIL